MAGSIPASAASEPAIVLGKTLEDLYDELNKREFLRGRFIVFPHVGEGGASTMLRSGFAAKYKNMPCVGGFVDGSVTQHGKGNSDILNGRNKEYGNKASDRCLSDFRQPIP